MNADEALFEALNEIEKVVGVPMPPLMRAAIADEFEQRQKDRRFYRRMRRVAVASLAVALLIGMPCAVVSSHVVFRVVLVGINAVTMTINAYLLGGHNAKLRQLGSPIAVGLPAP